MGGALIRMDAGLAGWARAAGAREATRDSSRRLPVLWLFTDRRRLADPLAAAARLPRGRAGVVLRDDDDPGRAALGLALARLCRARRLALVVAGDVRLAAALGAGVHLRGGRWPDGARPGPLRRCGRPAPRLLTSSAHTPAELRRARRAGAALAFLSPAFPTASHPGGRALGPARWATLARRAGLPVAALGGVAGGTVRRLPRGLCRAIGAIGGLA